MTEIFLKIVNMSISATYLALAVILLRFALKKAPKWVNVLLWGLVAVRLICPFTLESTLSLIPSAETVSPEILLDPTPTIHTGIEALNSTVNPVISETFSPAPGASANPLQIWIPVLSILWVTGMALMLLYTLVSYQHLRRQVKMAIRVKGNVYLSEFISSPFVLGVFRPKIYLPYHMNEMDRFHVLAHERTHIRRKDHWWKPLGFLLLTVHWFNPIMWIAYVLLCRDIELACDEKVIKELDVQQRADYSQALLNCSIDRKTIAACPVAFGEVGVKERVKNVLRYRKPAFWIVLIAIVACIAVAVCFITDPVERNTPYSITSTLKAEDVQQASATLWGETDLHSDLHADALNKLIGLLNALPEGEFNESPGITHEVSIMLLCGEHNLLLAYGDDYVEFIPDSQTAETFGNITWAVRNDDLNIFFKNAIQPQTDWNITLTAENVTPTGLTVLWHQDETMEEITVISNNNFRLQSQTSGEWADIAPSEDATPSIHATYSGSESDRQVLDWSVLYGELPPGTYRIATDVELLHIFTGESRTLYAEFTIEAADGLSLLTDNADGSVCISIIPTEVGAHRYAVIPDQDAAKAAFEKAMDALDFGTGWNGDTGLGIHVEYQGEYLYLTESGAIVTFNGRIPADAASELYDLALNTAIQVGWQESVKPEDLTGIRSARLEFCGTVVTLEDGAKLDKLEAMLSRSQYLYGGAGCPFGNLLTLEMDSGKCVTISMAADSCAAWLSNGVFYDYGSGNEEFYSLFAANVIHEKAQEGYESVTEVLRYLNLNWSDYANTYGFEDTTALMNLLREWAMEEPTLDRISAMMYHTIGLDGIYTEYYSGILRELYDANPRDFSWACIGNATGEVETLILELMAWNMGISVSETRALFESNIPQT